LKNRILLLITTICLSYFQAFGGNADSLYKQLSKANITEKPVILNKIAQSYIPGSPEKGLNYALQAIDQARTIGSLSQEALGNKIAGAAWYNLFQYEKAMDAYQKSITLFTKLKDNNQIASVHLNIGLIFRDQNKYHEARIEYQRSLAIYDSLKSLPGKANVYNYLGGLSWKQGELKSALSFYEKLLQIRIQLKNSLDIANAYNRIALIYKETGQYDRSLEYYSNALEYYQTSGNSRLIAGNLNDMGNVYWKKMNHEKALEYYFRAVKLRYKTEDNSEIAGSYINIGTIYFSLENYQKAKEYYNQALVLYSESLQKRKIANTLTLLGTTEAMIDNKPEALDLYNRALSIRRKMGDNTEIAQSLNNLGNILSELNEPSKALSHFNEALKIRTALNDTIGRIITLNDIGNLYEKTKQYALATNYFNNALNFAKNSNNNYHISLCSRKLAEIGLKTGINKQQIFSLLNNALAYGNIINHAELIKNAEFAFYTYYYQNNNFEKALQYYIRSSNINDSLQNLKNNNRITSIQQNIEIEKKNNELRAFENEVMLLRQEKEIQDISISKQTHFRNNLIVISLLTILIALLFIRLYYLKRKTNLQLKEQYQLLKDANEQLIARENELKKLNSTKDKYFSIIAHDIKNPLSALMNLSHIIIEKFDTLKTDKIQEFNKMIYESANNLHTLLENLLYWARANTNKIAYKPENIQLKTIINNIFLINKLSANQKNIQLTDHTDSYEVYADLQMLTSILRNLVSNAIKFTPEGGNIEIMAVNQGRMIEVSVSDSGVGMDTENLDKLFRLDSHFSQRGTNNEVGTGLGLILVKEFVEKNQGKISVWSEPGKGSIFTFSIPNSTW
jgi:signal transduction histidine kinase/tetratricopeptide (TPR) repeat protein